jgi:hypothetical protein
MSSTSAVAVSIQAVSPELIPSVEIASGTAGMNTARMLIAISSTRKISDFFIGIVVLRLLGCKICVSVVNNYIKIPIIGLKTSHFRKKIHGNDLDGVKF